MMFRHPSIMTIGVVCAVAASTAFTLNDVGIKFLSGDYALHQIVFFRSVIALVLTLAILVPLEGGIRILKTRQLSLHMYRGLAVVIANMSFFMGLAAMPLADATAVFFISPLVVTAFSVIFLSEKVGAWRWAAVFIGLLGAMVIMRPGTSAFQPAALFPVLAAFGYASLHMFTRKIGQTEKASTISFYTMLVFVVVSGLIGLIAGDGRFAGSTHPSIAFLTRAWILPSQGDAMVMIGIGVASTAGGYLISQAYRLCEAALMAPFEYVALILAIVWGVVIFGEWPHLVVWVGMGLILFSGLFIVWRESTLKRG